MVGRNRQLRFRVAVRRGIRLVLSAGIAALVAHSAVAEPLYEVENYGIAAPLTAVPGDIERGQRAVVDQELGNCLSCHAAPVDAEFFGTVGPSLVAVGARLSPAQLRLRLVDPKRIYPETVMPAYFKTEGLERVLEEFQGKPILSAQQIEDVVAYLASLQ